MTNAIHAVANGYRVFGGTTAEWAAHDDPLYYRELGIEYTDDGRVLMKVGIETDGDVGTPWSQLPYIYGPAGLSPAYEWDGTNIRFKNPDGTWGDWVDLKGARGLRGEQGEIGDVAPLLPATETELGGVMQGEHTSITPEGCLSVPEATEEIFGVGRMATPEEVENGALQGEGPAFVSVADVMNLRGPKGDKGNKGEDGPQGLAPAHSWSGYSLRFQNPDKTWGAYTNLRGPQGPQGPIGFCACDCDWQHCTSDN